MKAMRAFVSMIMVAAILPSFASPPDPTVYALAKGKSYHVKNCRMKHGSKAMKLSLAKRQGYKACKVCKPPK